MKPFKVINSIACDYVTIGANGKPIILHTFVGDIIVREFPALFPMSFYIELAVEPDAPSEIKVRVLLDETERVEMVVQFDYNPSKIGLLVIPQFNLAVDKESTLRVVASGEGVEDMVLIEKRISVGTIPA